MLTNDPVTGELPVAVVPLPTRSTGALVLTNGEPDVPLLPVEPSLAPPDAAGLPVAGVPLMFAPVESTLAGDALVVWSPGDAGAVLWHVLARAEAVDVVVPASASPRRDTPHAITTAAVARLNEVVMSEISFVVVGVYFLSAAVGPHLATGATNQVGRTSHRGGVAVSF